jgi:hypothetical protein
MLRLCMIVSKKVCAGYEMRHVQKMTVAFERLSRVPIGSWLGATMLKEIEARAAPENCRAHRPNRCRSLTASVLLAITASWPAPLEAHDIYTVLKDRFGGSCCSEHDCRPAHYRITPAGVQMRVSGEWIVVPGETIQYRTVEGDTGETAGGHWCGYKSVTESVTRCAILPPSSASSTQVKSGRISRP